jgi:hypothetical protein
MNKSMQGECFKPVFFHKQQPEEVIYHMAKSLCACCLLIII